MEVMASDWQGYKLIAIEGEVDLNSSPQVRQTFGKLIDGGALKMIVDFSKVAYIDSSGLATLIEMMQRLKKKQGTMFLVEMSDKIKGLFEITKLDKLFRIYPTKEEVLSAA